MIYCDNSFGIHLDFETTTTKKPQTNYKLKLQAPNSALIPGGGKSNNKADMGKVQLIKQICSDSRNKKFC